MTENLIIMIIAMIIMTVMAFILGYLFSEISNKDSNKLVNTEQPTMLEKVFTKHEKIKEESEYTDEKVNPFYQ